MPPDDHQTLLDLLISQETGHDIRTDTIPRVARDQKLPLSFPQQRMWFLHEMGITGNAYTIPMNLALHGALDIDALESALSTVVARHEVLRTVVRTFDGVPQQVVQPASRIVLAVQTIAAAGLDAAVDASNEAPFDIATGPVLRARLLRLGPVDHVLLLAVHHIAFDGWSVGVFLKELTTLYRSFRARQPSPFPPLPLQYADYAAWQRAMLDRPDAHDAIGAWRSRLAGAVPVSLPAELPRPPILGFRGGRCAFRLPSGVLDRLERLGRERGATVFMVLLTGFAALMHRISGEGLVAIGTPVAGRDRAEIEGLLGFFVNSVVMAVDVEGDPSFVDLLDRVRAVALDAYAHADIPFETLVEALAPERGLDRNPLFQVMFALQQPEAMAPDLAFEGLSATPIPFARITSRFDLELHVWPVGGALDGICTYNLDLFTGPTIERMLGHLAHLLGAAAADPHRPVGELPLHDADETRVLTGPSGPPPLCLHQSLATIVRERPDTLALVDGDVRFTLGELDAWANRIAHMLRAHGAGPGMVVSLCIDRGAAMIAAFLGVFKAGACYLPVDPAEPTERLRFILGDSQAQIHLTQASHAHLFQHSAKPGLVLSLDTLADALQVQPATDPLVGVGPDDLAYIIYTSGSTGRPKGVEGRHGTIANLVAWHRRAHPHPPLRTLQYAQCSFDIFFQELFTSWLDGAACYMATEAMRQDMHALAALIVHHRIERIFMPFAPMQYLIEILARQEVGFLREVTTAGEQLQATPAVRDFFRANPQARLHNHYGPTECYVVAAHALPPDPAAWADLPPVGQAVDNVRLTLVDRHLVRVPIGVAGEILIGGAQISRGYRNRPSQTAAAFIPDPAGPPGARLYRTGDLGRRLPDGSIEFLGRMDRQIKIRGFRIEPGEIEVMLCRHPEVKQALIAVHRYSGTDARLTAYIVPRSGTAPSDAALRAWLQGRLPRQMVPNAFVPLPALPLNVSGKIDRYALPPPRPEVADNSLSPRSPMEQAIAEIFSELLRRDHVGPHDNFFDLGGHSLLATRVVARLRSALGVELPLVRLFETPTVAGIAAFVAAQSGTPAIARIPMLDRETAPASFAQRRLWLLDQLGTAGPAYLMPVNLRLSGPLNRDALRRSIEAIVHRHATLRSTLHAVDGQPVQRIALPVPFDLPLVDATAEALDALVQHANTAPFDLACDLPIRVRLVRLSDIEHVLLVTFHHVACDGWSVMVFFRELAALYGTFADGLPPILSPLPIQYADYVAWQHAELSPQVVEAHLAYWRPLLDGVAPLRLPTDRLRPAQGTSRAGGVRFIIPAPVADGLRTLAATEGATLYMVMLAAFMALLHRFSGDTRIAVGTPVANRDRDEIEGLIGFFVNALVMTATVAPAESFRALLGQVRHTALGGFAHQALPFDTLVEALAPTRDTGRNPLFQALFALQQPETMNARLTLGGLDVVPLDQTAATTRFDLEFHAWPQDGALHGFAAYDRDLFDEATIATLLDAWQAVLYAVAEDPSRAIQALPLATALVAPSPASVLPAPVSCLHDSVMAIALATPHARAVTAGTDTLAYAELQHRALSLARRIIALRLPPEAPVALLLPRGTGLVVAMLAVLQSGHPYLPLEPLSPPDRLGFILADARAALVLTDAATAERMAGSPFLAGRHMLVLDAAPDGEALPATALPAIHPDSLAYIIYTSGSTGRPKGVAVTHANAARLFTTLQPYFGFDADDVWTCFHSAAFDFSVWEIWGALLHGGRVVMVGTETARMPAAFLNLIEQEGVTVLNQTPSAFAQLAEAALDRPARLKLRWVVLGGEAVDVAALRRWFERFGDTHPRLVNCYGITETTVHVTLRPLGLHDLDLPFGSPVGRAIPDLSVRLLDASLDPVPDGAPGEIVVAGAGVARGYLHAPALTAARFVPDPSGPPGARMYRSGDSARRRAGDVEYLGRIDQQVKLRGYRIETGEITTLLRAHPAIADVATVLRDDALVAYLVPAILPGQDRVLTEDWRTVFDEQLDRDWEHVDPLFRLTGWSSSYEPAPIAPTQMRAWADGTVAQIMALKPRRVLEIGCGTGILLFRLAEQVEAYHGIDFSRASLDHVGATIAAHAPRFGNVTIEERAAQDLAGLPPGFDTIIINSVVQYFPSLDMLRQVLTSARTLLAPGGTIYIGDVRDFRLGEAFHASILHARDPGTAGLAEAAKHQALGERELLVDPAFFAGLVPGGAYALLAQRGTVINELNAFRYAAVLRPDGLAEGTMATGYDAGGLDEKGIADLLPGHAVLRRIVNARTRASLALLGQESSGPAIDPEALHLLAERHGLIATVAPSMDGRDFMDVWFGPASVVPWTVLQPDRSNPVLSSDPTRRQALVEAIPSLGQHLSTFLPDYMIPTHFVVLDALPLTLNGKLDTRSLPAPVPGWAGRSGPRTAASTVSERAVEAVFIELLGQGDYDIDDDFFVLGGHSLLATRLCSRLRARYNVDLPLIRVFETPTIRMLAHHLDASLVATVGAGQSDDPNDERVEGEI